jgi:hypothetical protein
MSRHPCPLNHAQKEIVALLCKFSQQLKIVNNHTHTHTTNPSLLDSCQKGGVSSMEKVFQSCNL